MSNPFVNSSFTESAEVEVHQATTSDVKDDQMNVQSSGGLDTTTTTGTSWVQFDENGEEVKQHPAKTGDSGEYVQLQHPPPRSSRQVPPNGQALSSISSSSDPKQSTDTNYATIELSHTIEITHPPSAIPKQQQLQSSSTGGSHLKVNNAAGTSLSTLPQSPSPSVASSSNGTSSNTLSHFGKINRVQKFQYLKCSFFKSQR